MATTKTQVPSIPAVPKNEREATAFYNAVKEAVEVRLGRRGDPKDRAVTLRELIDSGMAKELLDNPFDPNAGTGVTDFVSSSTYVDGKLDDTNDLTAPPTPTGLAASAGTTKIIVSWNKAQISNLAHTEVWRSSDSSLGNAVRHDTTEAFVWVDSVDPGEQYYYWIRHVTTAGIFSPFAGSVNATGVLIAGTKIAADAITATKIADDAITTPKILTNAVTADSIAGNTITAANIAANELTSASGIFGTLDASEMNITNINASNITTGSLSGGKITADSLDVAGKSIADSLGRIAGTAGNDVSMSSFSEILQSNFVNTAPHHIAAADHSDASVSAGDVMGGSPLFSHTFNTYSFSGTRPFIVSVFLDPIGIFDSASGTGFAFAMRATGTSGAYTSTNANDYVTTRGTSKGGTIASQNYLLSDIVTLSPNTQYYIWVFGVIDDVDQNSQGTRGIRDGAIQIYGLNK